MSWQYSDAPSHIAPEVGPNVLAGDGPWSGVALDPGAVYVLSVEVNAPGETTVGWGVTVTDGSGGEYALADPADAETVPGGQWVTVTRNLPAPAFPTTATVTLAVPTGTQARNPSMGVRTGRTVLTVPGDVLAENIMAYGGIVAGTPGAARVELTDEGLVAFDATGTETAHIRGDGGEFEGGSYRTSDNLPGQVTLSDTAARGGPGIEIEPTDPSGYSELPSIGPESDGMAIRGGRSVAGESAGSIQRHDISTLWHNGPGASGSGAWAQASGNDVRLSYFPDRSESGRWARVVASPDNAYLDVVRDNYRGFVGTHPDHVNIGVHFGDNLAEVAVGASSAQLVSRGSQHDSWVYVDENETYLRRASDGMDRYLSVDDDGVWVKTLQDGQWKHYNLEETAATPPPEIVPVTGTNGWSADGSPTGGIIVTHSATGRVCTARLRLTRTGDETTFGPPYQTIGPAPGSATMWIPPELRIPATDYFGIRIPVSQPATGILFADFATGEFRVKADTSATITTGQYITVDLTWFIPN